MAELELKSLQIARFSKLSPDVAVGALKDRNERLKAQDPYSCEFAEIEKVLLALCKFKKIDFMPQPPATHPTASCTAVLAGFGALTKRAPYPPAQHWPTALCRAQIGH